jgi:hypothetical protein
MMKKVSGFSFGIPYHTSVAPPLRLVLVYLPGLLFQKRKEQWDQRRNFRVVRCCFACYSLDNTECHVEHHFVENGDRTKHE